MSHLGTIICGVALTLFTVGCQSVPSTDSQISRASLAAETAFAEGRDAEAIDGYRRALKRAWLLDDSVEISNNAYHLALVYSSLGQVDYAHSWLYEAQAEATRAGIDDTNLTLLEAKITRRQGCPDESHQLADQAVQYRKFTLFASECDCQQRRCCVAEKKAWNFGWVLQSYATPKSTSKCETKAQANLIQASSHCDCEEVESAKHHFEKAQKYLDKCDSPSLYAESDRVAGHIHLLQNDPLAAACHFDSEADWLRCAQGYREIPMAYQAAAEAYELAGRADLAAVRYYWVARILYARGEPIAALQFLQYALAHADQCDASVHARLALLLSEINEIVSTEADELPAEESTKGFVPPAPATSK